MLYATKKMKYKKEKDIQKFIKDKQKYKKCAEKSEKNVIILFEIYQRKIMKRCKANFYVLSKLTTKKDLIQRRKK